MIREELLALADELDGVSLKDDCESCLASVTGLCRGDVDCAEAVHKACAKRLREIVERDECEVTTVSAYNLLSEEDRKAIAWVREHGGLDMVASRFESGKIAADMLWGKGHGRFWTTDEFEEEISKRLMPAGCELPRFEDGEPVRVGDKLMTSDGAVRVEELSLTICDTDGGVTCVPFGEHVKRPTVLAADGEPLEVGQTVYAPHYDYVRCTVLSFEWAVDGWLVEVENEGGCKFRQTPNAFIHKRPVFDADGVLIKEGDTVWSTRGSKSGTVVYAYPPGGDGQPSVKVGATWHHASDLTHVKPEPPDSWERVEEDASLAPGDYIKKCGRKTDLYAYQEMPIDLVRRCRALAERGEL